jgi:IS605 OrfB family transposase
VLRTKSDTYTPTYQTRGYLVEAQDEVLCACADLFGIVGRSLFADLARGKLVNECKSFYIKKHQITARHFNAVRVQVEGKISSAKALQQLRQKALRDQIESLERFLEKRLKRDSKVVHQKKRRLAHIKARLLQLEGDIAQGKVRLCFGSKKLFRAQFALAANGYQSHEEWKEDWMACRSNSFFLLGSKDETAGNQSATASIQENGRLSLRIRLPDALSAYGKYFVIKDLYFSYGHDHIVAALKDSTSRVAISYRFVRDEKGWRILATLPIKKSVTITRKELGVIGVDINADHLAVVETDHSGNPIHHVRLELNTYGKRAGQAKALMGDAAKTLVHWSRSAQKPIVLEELSFDQKKSELRQIGNPRYARMLSSFAYNEIEQFITSSAGRNGVEVEKVNPAYTSVIGRAKFCKRYGLSIHESAALCIGRRFLGVSERLPRHLDEIADGKGGYITVSLPVRNRGTHVWSSWRQVRKRLPAALAAHFRAVKNRSSGQSNLACCDTKRVLNLVGEKPPRESTAELLGCRI